MGAVAVICSSKWSSIHRPRSTPSKTSCCAVSPNCAANRSRRLRLGSSPASAPRSSKRVAAAHVFVADLEHPVLDADDRHHLLRVLRLRPGETVTVSDGMGASRCCELAVEGQLAPVTDISREARPIPLLTVAFALVKGERPEWVVQKLTEVGVDVIVPFMADRSVVRWDAGKADHHGARLRRVAREAAMQSRRTWLPEVGELASFTELAAQPGAAMAVPGGGPPSLDHPCLLVGPEGGWSDAELRSGLPRVGLGALTLRAETAAISSGVLLSALRFGMVSSTIRGWTEGDGLGSE